jgi:phosphohistidine phosphatase
MGNLIFRKFHPFMELILLRHGKAEDTNVGGDFPRELLEKGREQARQAARLLVHAGTLPDIVLTSPLIRARQTADEFCQAAAIPGAVIQGWLACGMTPEQALRELVAFQDFKRVAIVGHEPDFSGLIEALLGAGSSAIEVRKGTLACVRLAPPACHGTLVYLIPPKQAGHLSQ